MNDKIQIERSKELTKSIIIISLKYEEMTFI